MALTSCWCGAEHKHELTRRRSSHARQLNPVRRTRLIRVGAVMNEALARCAKNSQRRAVTNLRTPLYMLTTLGLPCVKLSPTCHAALGRCGGTRGEATHMSRIDLVSSSLVAIHSVCNQSSHTCVLRSCSWCPDPSTNNITACVSALR